jgi:inorganic pyrophosphatase/exopolyphosphatase
MARHKVPDTDAICAAMIYAWELQSRGARGGNSRRVRERIGKAAGEREAGT